MERDDLSKRTTLRTNHPMTPNDGIDADLWLFRYSQNMFGAWMRSSEETIAPFITCSTCERLAFGGRGNRLSCGRWQCFVKFHWLEFKNWKRNKQFSDELSEIKFA